VLRSLSIKLELLVFYVGRIHNFSWPTGLLFLMEQHIYIIIIEYRVATEKVYKFNTSFLTFSEMGTYNLSFLTIAKFNFNSKHKQFVNIALSFIFFLQNFILFIFSVMPTVSSSYNYGHSNAGKRSTTLCYKHQRHSALAEYYKLPILPQSSAIDLFSLSLMAGQNTPLCLSLASFFT